MDSSIQSTAVDPAASGPELVSPGTQKRAVESLLGVYFDALYEADADKMGAIFHPQGVYATADQVPALIRDRDTYLAVLRDRQSPQSRGEARNDHIDNIEFAGGNTARAKVRCSISGSDFVDFLTLVREEGRWQIMSKIFQIAN